MQKLTYSRKNLFVFSLWVMVVLCLRMLVSIFLHPLRIGWDPALHLQCAELIVKGGIPYVDMLDVNPPLIWYLDTLPVLVSEAFKAPVTLVFNEFMVLLMAWAASALGYLLIKKAQPGEAFAYLGLIFGALYFNFFLRWDFGQREEIFVLLYLPYLVLRLLRYQGARFTIAEGLIFGITGSIGICLKHYFVLVALMVELSMLLAYRRPRVLIAWENLGVLVFALLYLIHFAFAPKEMLDNYFHFLVPAFAKGYFFWDTCLANSIAAPDKRGVFYLACLGAALAFTQLKRAAVLLPLVVFTLASIIPYLLQFKGWPYHDIPVFAGACMLITTSGASIITSLVKKQTLALPMAALAVITGVSLVNSLEESQIVRADRQYDMTLLGYKGTAPWADIDSPFTEYLMQYTKPLDPVIFISNGVSPGYPLLTQFRLMPGSRHLHCCILSVLQYIKDAATPSLEVKELLAKEPQVIEQYGSDIEKRKPVLIFVQEAPVVEYLRPYEFFAKYMKDYKKIGSAANFDVYKREGVE